MTERIIPEQIANLRRLHAERTAGDFVFDSDERYDRATKDYWWEQQITAPDGRTVDLPDGSWKEWRFLVAAANCIIPALDEIERLSEAVKAIKSITHEGLYDYDGDDMQEALEMIARHCAIALALPPAREEGMTTDE